MAAYEGSRDSGNVVDVQLTGATGVPIHTDEIMASLIAWHDAQLRATPLSAIRQALNRLERLRDGKSFNQLPARR
ncbi:hypothetical protein [Burkholderia gladioli]|uniref:hypothetical protein n=1 Tax=Burkholderia gladioli TaxID=28095 RepID=UPI0016421D24|nr:hypothetical protein [Burkholderia gladioli]